MNRTMQRLNRTLNPDRPAGFRLLSSKLALTVALLGALPFTSLSAEPAPAEKPGTPNRWLVIVDTSSRMESRSEAARQITKMLIVSGMDGQMRRGDSLGLWTFNQNLYAGQFPLQEIKPETSRVTARRADDFLQELKNEKSSRLDKVLPEMMRLIKASEYITVVLISHGDNKIHGTPFDDKINEAYRTWRDQQNKNQMPFITVLRARRGEITDFSVNMPPWPLQLPPLPNELLPVTAKPAPKPEPQKAPAALIVSGKKTEPAPVPAPAATVVTSTTITAAATATNVSASSNAAAIAVTTPTNLTTAAPIAAQPAKAEVQPPKTPPAVTPVMAAELAKPNSTASSPSPAATTVATTTTPPASEAPLAPRAETHATTEDDSSAARDDASAPTVMSFFMNGLFNRKILWIGVGILVASLVGMMLLKGRRAPAPSRISLITRSFDQEQR